MSFRHPHLQCVALCSIVILPFSIGSTLSNWRPSLSPSPISSWTRSISSSKRLAYDKKLSTSSMCNRRVSNSVCRAFCLSRGIVSSRLPTEVTSASSCLRNSQRCGSLVVTTRAPVILSMMTANKNKIQKKKKKKKEKIRRLATISAETP